MSKVFNSCFFWKRKSKSPVENSRKTKNNIIYVKKDPHLKDVFYDYQDPQRQIYKSSRKRVSENLEQNYSPRRSLPQNRAIRSYPVSPERSILKRPGETDYFSDHYYTSFSSRANPYGQTTSNVYAARIPQASSQFIPNTPSTQEIKEPFPYKIPVSVPRRSSLFYGIKYQEDTGESSQYKAEKPIEDSNPNVAREEDDRNKVSKGKKHVSIIKPDSGTTSFVENIAPTEVVKKTIVRFRPSSSSNCAPASDTVKIMPVQKQPNPPLPGKYVHHIPLKHNKLSSDLMTTDGRKLTPVIESEDKVRASIAQAKLRESQAARGPLLRAPLTRRSYVASDGGFSTSEEEPVLKTVHVIPARRSIGGPSGVRPSVITRQSLLHREPIGRRQSKNSWKQSVNLQNSGNIFPLRQEESPAVFAVPRVPTRGRSKSILKQSIKYLTAKNPNNMPIVNRKNIRFSTDADVFAAEVRKPSVATDNFGFVNMEKGQPLLVSDVLNPITSLFISDLKDPVPKDPLTKPIESNVWVAPKRQRQSFQRTPLIKQRPVTPNVHVMYEGPPTRMRSIQRKHSRSYQRYSRDDSSVSSEDSFDVVPRKSKHGKRQYYQHVYTAEMSDALLPDISKEKNVKLSGTHPQPSTSKDYCGLTVNAPENSLDTLVNKVSSEYKMDAEEEKNLVCHPSQKCLNDLALNAKEPGSKLRWRIIIKRGDEK